MSILWQQGILQDNSNMVSVSCIITHRLIQCIYPVHQPDSSPQGNDQYVTEWKCSADSGKDSHRVDALIAFIFSLMTGFYYRAAYQALLSQLNTISSSSDGGPDAMIMSHCNPQGSSLTSSSIQLHLPNVTDQHIPMCTSGQKSNSRNGRRLWRGQRKQKKTQWYTWKMRTASSYVQNRLARSCPWCVKFGMISICKAKLMVKQHEWLCHSAWRKSSMLS